MTMLWSDVLLNVGYIAYSFRDFLSGPVKKKTPYIPLKYRKYAIILYNDYKENYK